MDNFSTDNESKGWLIGLAVAVVIALLAWLAWSRLKAPEPVEPAAVTEPAPPAEVDEGPDYPLREPLAGSRADADTLRPLPPLSDSDSYFQMELADAFGAQLEKMLADEALIEKFVATVDNLPRGRVAERLRPLEPTPGAFIVSSDDAGESFTLSEQNFERYALLVNLFSAADPDALVDSYRRFYPLLQEAYVNLGYPDGYFNDRMVEVIDDLLSTPVPDEPLQLKRPHVMYEYADPALEALSSGQKLMLRMGNEQAAAVKQQLAAIRARLVDSARQDDDPAEDATPDDAGGG